MRRRPNSVASSDNNDDDDNVYHTDEDDYDDEDEPDQIGSGTGSRKALWSGGLSSTSLPSNRSSKNIKQQQYQSQHQQHRQGYVYGSSPTASNAAALEERVHQKLGGSRRYNNNAEFENTTQNNDSNLAYLLTPPPTEDRSERRRYETSLRNSPLQTNTNSNTASQPKIRRRGLYDGELEPEGVRGQEAVFSSPPSLPTASSLGNVVGGISPLKLLPLVTPPPSQRQTATTPTTVSNHTLRMNSIHSSSNMHSLADVSHESSSYEDASLAIAAAPAPPPPTRQPLPPHSSSRPKRAVDRMVQYHEQKRPTRLQIPSPSRVKKPAGQQQLHPRPSAVGLQQQQTQLPHVPTPRPTKQPPQQQQLPKRLSSDGESTCSDEDISYLISKEFVRSLSGGTNRSDGGTSREVVPPTKPKTTMPNVFASSAQASQRQDRPSNNETYSDDNDIPPIRSALSVKAAKAGRGLSIKNLPPLSSSSSRHDRKVPRGAMENGHATPTTDPLIAVDSGELDELKSIEQWQTTASIAVQEGDFATGLAAFTAVLQAQTQRYGARAPHAAVAAAYHNLGTVHAKRAAAVTASMGTPTSSSQSSNSAVQLEAIRQDRAAALECFQAAARCARDATPPGARAPHPNVAVSLVRVGFLLLQSKQYENAIVTFSEALRIRLAVYGTKHALSANLYNNLGVCCLHMGEFAQGLVHLEQALEIQRYLVAQDKEGQQDRPEEQNNRGAAAAADALVVHQLELADTLFNIGGLCLEWMRRQGPDSRRADQAVSSFEECYSIRSTVLGPTDPRTEQAGVLRTTANSLPRPRRILQLAPPKEKSEASFATASTSRWMNTTRNLITGNKVSAFNKETSESRSNRIINNQSISSGNHVVEPPAVKRSLQVNSPIFGENFPTSLSPIRFDKDFDDSNETTSIFRIGGINNHSPLRPTTLPSENSKNIHRSIDDQDAHQHTAPLLQISVSKEESEENFNDDDEEQRNTTGTRVYTAPYHVSPGVLENERTTRGLNDVSVDVVVNESSYEKDGFAVDSSNESRLRPHLSSSYDAEENCLISDSGVDSRIGRIHYPLAWNRAGIQSNAEQATPRSRDILLARPTTNSNSHQYKETIHNGKLERKNFVRVNSAASDKWGSETVNVSTGNKERDDILARARQMLLEHSSPDSKGNSFDEDNKTAAKTNKLILRKKTKAQTRTGNAVSDQEMIEEGIAPLGGSWGNNSSGSSQNICLMLKDPIQHLKEIHDEATKQLKIGNVVDAQRLFDVVLECQRHRHGHLHPDVAAALHNLGITHLRAHNHSEALKVFEEAARVRKGSLGKDHALVAV